MAVKFKKNKRNFERIEKEEPAKDSSSKRVNFDNESKEKFDKQYQRRDSQRKSNKPRKQNGSRNNNGSNSSRTGSYTGSKVASQLALAATNYTFSTYAGQPMKTLQREALMGVMAFPYEPAFGLPYGFTGELSTAAQSVYTYVVHANSRNTTYDANDLLLVCMAGGEIYRAIANAIRAYGIARNFENDNRYTPISLLQAMGFNPNDVFTHLSNMWFDINYLISRAQQLWIPNVFTYIEDQFKLNSTVFMDAETPKAQFYLFTPGCFYFYDQTYSSDGSGLRRHALSKDFFLEPPFVGATGLYDGTQILNQEVDYNKLYTWSEYTSMVNDMLDFLIAAGDRGTIMGDIRKAYTDAELYSIQEIPADYKISPIYDISALEMIQNLKTSYVGPSAFYQTNHQNSPLIEKTPIFTEQQKHRCANALMWTNPILNFNTASDPTPDQIYNATRFVVGDAAIKLRQDGKYEATHYYCGFEVVQAIYVFGMNYETSKYIMSQVPQMPWLNDTSSPWITPELVAQHSLFDWAPHLYLTDKYAPDLPTVADQGTDTAVKKTNFNGDINNFCVLTWDEIEKIQRARIRIGLGL